MKINEVETLAGITKKNIRFYEVQGLLSPKRNPENGYRDYGEEEVLVLLAQRKTIPDIEAELFISNSTAKAHCKGIYRKLGVHKREELLRLVGHPSSANDQQE